MKPIFNSLAWCPFQTESDFSKTSDPVNLTTELVTLNYSEGGTNKV